MAQDADDLEDVKRDMQCALADLPLQPTRIGYCALLLKQNEYDCYIQGRYALKSDKDAHTIQKISDVLLFINDQLTSYDINWMVYGAAALTLQGLDFALHDLDILTDAAGLESITNALTQYLTKIQSLDASDGCTVKVSVSTFMINGIQVECKTSPTHSPLLGHAHCITIAAHNIPVISLDGQLQSYRICSRKKDLPKIDAIKQHQKLINHL
jgi:hypothetical protein